ncbi:helitron helicase-like domain-containing protein [Artemisia annua]|uniref:Helitron helicase-like domain-containing protein n=1 Tax=Artemisia annua TaxID=35608 RepID=A0A2U1P0Q6_ARTAN|nr:helitron helicase-like domain-containing protein [Artemisia annua]
MRPKVKNIDAHNGNQSRRNSPKESCRPVHECVAIPAEENRLRTSFDSQCITPSPLTRSENLRLTSTVVSSQDALYKQNERISNRMFQLHNGLGSHEPNVPLDTFVAVVRMNLYLIVFQGRGRRTSKRQRQLKERRFQECGGSSQNSPSGDVAKRSVGGPPKEISEACSMMGQNNEGVPGQCRDADMLQPHFHCDVTSIGMPLYASVCLPSEYDDTDSGQSDLRSSSESRVHIAANEHCHQPPALHSSVNTCENDSVYHLSLTTVEPLAHSFFVAEPTSSAPPPGQRKRRAMSQSGPRRASIRRRYSTADANEGASPVYQDVGGCTERCRYCDAMFWPGEQLAGHRSNTGHPKYHLCCGDGKLLMDPEVDPPEYIKQLLGQNTFMQNIRAYNQMFAMTSFGATIDNTVNQRRGPYVFKVSGQIYHWIGALCPTGDDDPCFLQLYIYDTRNEVRNRMSHFEDSDGHPLDPEIVQGLIEFLDAHNELVQLFRTARDKCAEAEVPDFKVRLFNAKGSRNYELPTSDALGAIVFDNGPTTEADYDVIIEYRDAPPKRINKLHQSYMSLQFPLIFIYGQPGYHTKLMMRSADLNEKMKRMEDAAIDTMECPTVEQVVGGADATIGEETNSTKQKMVEVQTVEPLAITYHDGLQENTVIENVPEKAKGSSVASDHKITARTLPPTATKIDEETSKDRSDEAAKVSKAKRALFEDDPSHTKKQKVTPLAVTHPEAPQEGTTEVNVTEKLDEPSTAPDHETPVPTQTGTPVTSSTKITEDYSKKETNQADKTKAPERDLFEDEPSDMKKQKGKIKDSANNTPSHLFHQYFTITLARL